MRPAIGGWRRENRSGGVPSAVAGPVAELGSTVRSQAAVLSRGVPPLAAGVGDVQQSINDFAKVQCAASAARGVRVRELDEVHWSSVGSLAYPMPKIVPTDVFPGQSAIQIDHRVLNVQIFHILQIVNQILTGGSAHHCPLISSNISSAASSVTHSDTLTDSCRRIHRRLPQLLRIHLAQTLIPLNRIFHLLAFLLQPC